MKIETYHIPAQTLEAFADEHDLTMVIVERPAPVAENMRFYAHFKHAEIKIGSMLEARVGDAAFPDSAIKDYANVISGKVLIVNAADSKLCREIKVPRLIP